MPESNVVNLTENPELKAMLDEATKASASASRL